MNAKSFLTTCFLLCLLLAGTTTLSAQLRVLRPEAGILGSRVNVSGDSPHTPTANFSLRSNTHRIGLMIDHESSPVGGRFSENPTRVGMVIQYPQAQEAFTGQEIVLKQSSVHPLKGQLISLLNDKGGLTQGIDVTLDAYHNALGPTTPDGQLSDQPRNAIGVRSNVKESTGVLLNDSARDIYLAAYEGTLDHQYRASGFGMRLDIRNYGTIHKQSTYGLHVKYQDKEAGNSKVTGVYSEVAGKSNYAGHFVGNFLVNGQIFNSSDAALKHSVEGISGASELLAQLKPSSYQLLSEREESPERNHYGFIAQEMQEIMPDMVQSFVQPAVVDTAGNEVAPEQELLAVRYQDMIALLTAVAQEQQATITELAEEVAGLRERLSSDNRVLEQLIECTKCPIVIGDGSEGGGSFRSGETGDQNKSAEGGSYRLFPNPANDFFTIETPEQQEAFTVYLYSPDGKLVLTTASLRHRINVDTQGLPAGTYVVKLVDENGKVESRQVVIVR